jgi:hypothetical protein
MNDPILGAFPALRAGNRAFRSNSSAFPAGKPPVFPLQSLARVGMDELVEVFFKIL